MKLKITTLVTLLFLSIASYADENSTYDLMNRTLSKSFEGKSFEQSQKIVMDAANFIDGKKESKELKSFLSEAKKQNDELKSFSDREISRYIVSSALE